MAQAVQAEPRRDHWLDRVTLAGLLAFGGALQFSIVAGRNSPHGGTGRLGGLADRAARAPRGAALVLAAAGLRRSHARRDGLLLDRWASLGAAKQLLLFLVVPAVYRALRGRARRTAIDVVITVGAISAIVGVIAVRRSWATTRSSQRPRRHAGPLHDLLRPADAGHLQRRRPPAVRAARPRLAGPRPAGAGRRAASSPSRAAPGWARASASDCC